MTFSLKLGICLPSARIAVLKQLLILYCFDFLFVCLFLETEIQVPGWSGTCYVERADFKLIEISLPLPLILCFNMKE